MKTKEQIKKTLELFAVRTGNFQYSNPNNEFGGGRVAANPAFVKQLQVLFKEILPTTEEITELANNQATTSNWRADDGYEGFVQGAECVVKSITE